MKKVRVGISILIVGGVLFGGALLLHSRKEATIPEILYRPVFSDGTQLNLVANDVPILVKVASTATSRERGLSGTERLGENKGVLFVFDNPERPGFWMKDMRFPLDIIWLSSDFRIVDIDVNVSPDTYPEVFYPTHDIQYVLELDAGSVENHDFTIGELITFRK